jgi:hypothetical protein
MANFNQGTFTVTKENARAAYAGPMLVFTPPGGSAATIALKAVVLDATAPPAYADSIPTQEASPMRR